MNTPTPAKNLSAPRHGEIKRPLNASEGGATNRNRQLARIHCLKKEAGLTDSLYRDVLWTVARVRSAADLDAAGRMKVINHLAALVRNQRPVRPVRRSAAAAPLPRGEAAERMISNYLKSPPRVWGRAPRNLEQRPQLMKIAALLADAGRAWGYAESLAKRIAKKQRLELCSDADLSKIVAALVLDQQRRQAREAKHAGD